jgi:hypothetical protein
MMWSELMWNELFVGALGALFFAYLAWGFRRLPEEKWQIFATLPQRQDAAGYWRGLNFTYYGLLSSAAQFVSVAIIFLLFGAVGVTRTEIVLLGVVMLGACIPGSKVVALIVEKKSAVFSVGGAAFIGILLAPWAVLLSNATLGRLLGSEAPVLPVLAAISVGYAFGEGLGRLACISFGCCYGKPLHASHPLVQKLFARWHFVFRGETKKIAYAGNLAGEKVVPIQALTATLYTGVGLAGMLLFLHGAYVTALLLTSPSPSCGARFPKPCVPIGVAPAGSPFTRCSPCSRCCTPRRCLTFCRCRRRYRHRCCAGSRPCGIRAWCCSCSASG